MLLVLMLAPTKGTLGVVTNDKDVDDRADEDEDEDSEGDGDDKDIAQGCSVAVAAEQISGG